MPNVNKMLRRSRRGMKQIAGDNTNEYNAIMACAEVIFNDLNNMYALLDSLKSSIAPISIIFFLLRSNT